MSNKPKLPETLPGEFFVLVRDHDRERYTLIVDDADRTSYNLGSDIGRLMIQFRIWNLGPLGDNVIDLAKEFGACQGIPRENKAVPVFERPSDKARQTQRIDFSKEESSYVGHIPAIGG